MGINYPLKYTTTKYAGGYEFNLDARDVQLDQMIQSKLSNENLKKDSARANALGHQIVKNKTIVKNNPETIYYQKDYSSLIMFTDYVILKYIRENKPSHYIHSIETFRKPIEHEKLFLKFRMII